MKTAGIIGGLGPETTAKFYLEVVSLCQKVNGVNPALARKSEARQPPVLTYSVPLLYQQIEDEIIKGVRSTEVRDLLIKAAKILEKGGADFLVMPCNSLHVFIEDIRNAVKIPVLSIIEETARFLKNRGIFEVGILSTVLTRNNRLYDNLMTDQKIKCTFPTKSDQERLNKIILNLNLNQYGGRDRSGLVEIIDKLSKRGIRHVILACTDLQLLAPEASQVKIYDTMQILVETTVKEILKK